jgi:hypothetical protein
MRSSSRDEREFERTASRSFTKFFLILMAAGVMLGLLMGIIWLLVGLSRSSGL